jgi:MFS family permease
MQLNEKNEVTPTPANLPSTAMTPLERRSSASLAMIFALRMLGLFLVLPVFVLEAQKYPGGDDPVWVGLAMGIYGLTQALLQIPLGMAADVWGRKRVMVLGLIVFALGSWMAAWAPSLSWLVAGRALQGAGAISAAVTALLADQTRDVVRTKAMALVGASIGLMFALSLVLSPILASVVGLQGLFVLTGLLATAGIAVVLLWVPPETEQPMRQQRGSLRSAVRNPMLMRLHLGVFVLHAVQLAMWMAVPTLLVTAGIAQDAHWKIYLPAVLASFVVMGSTLFPLERRGYLRAVFLVAVAMLVLVQVALWWMTQSEPHWIGLALVLFLFFCSFNVLEASQPSLVSKWAPSATRATTLGIYNSLQSLGLFVGGWCGGWLVKQVGASGLFVTCAVALLVWFLLAWSMRVPEA